MLETLKHIDLQLFYFINHDSANGFFDILCPILRERLTWIPLYIIITFYLFKLYGQKTLNLSLPAVITVVLSDKISSAIIKPYFHRLRPCNNPELVSSVRLLLHDCGSGYSFVSSHAANHFAIAVFFMFLLPNKKRAIPALFLWAFIVALSQVYVGVHYPADIFCGAILGIIIGIACGILTHRLLFKQEPVASASGISSETFLS
jgi:undecaprenyl-diphosphatase